MIPLRFDADDLAGEAPPAGVRYLTHAIRPGTAPWLAFRATETIVVNNGFEFQARAWLGPLPVTTQDRYTAGHGASQIRLLGLLPIVTRWVPTSIK